MRNRTHSGSTRALVLGLGVSGVAAARTLLREGYAVTAIDASHGAMLEKGAAGLRERGATTVLNAESIPDEGFELCVVSPGIPYDSAWSREIRSREMTVISELELGATRCRCPVVAVTGTNGKSTMVKLCADMLREAGQRAEPAGNYGVPLSEVANRSASLDWVVAEVSSFQLEWPGTFRPRVGVLLNVQPDHLDRHGDLAHYSELKARLFSNMGEGDFCLVPENLPTVAGAAAGAGARAMTFGVGEAVSYRYCPAEVSRCDGGDPVTVNMKGTYFDNPILGLAAAAALGVADACAVESRAVERVLNTFTPLPHRMERVAIHGGVTYVDDSKATNLAAMAAALSMTPTPIHLIAGGLLKEKDLDCVKEVLAKRVASIYLVGDSALGMKRAWEGLVACRVSETMARAVADASESAVPGTTVLLSPGCASFDQFRSYRERGACFQGLVKSKCEEE